MKYSPQSTNNTLPLNKGILVPLLLLNSLRPLALPFIHGIAPIPLFEHRSGRFADLVVPLESTHHREVPF